MLRSPYALILSLLSLVLLSQVSHAAGVLVPRDGSAPIKVQSQRVTATVENGLARTTVRQTFINPHARALEAIYVFPVPEGAALVNTAMEVGGQRLEGLVIERKRARRIYDSIVRRREDPALVEQIGRSKFRLSVFPVLPGKETVVELTWIEHVPLRGGKYRYVYPLALAGGAARTERDLTVTVRMRSPVPITAASSPNEGMDVHLLSETHVLASLELIGAPLDRDVVVEADAATPDPSLVVRTYRDARGNGYYAAFVTPPPLTEADVLPRDVTLVLDTSGSMKGEKFEQAIASARFLLANLRATDRVNILRFSSIVEPFATAPVPATDANRASLTQFLDRLEAGGSTALGDALAAATAMPAAPGRVQTIVVLTDGRPTIGETDGTKIVQMGKAAREKGLRVFCFGVGGDVNATLLSGVSRAGGGKAEVFREGGEIRTRVERFLRRTSSPAMAKPVLTVDGVVTSGQLPRPAPDVYLGEQAVFTGRFRGAGEHAVRLTTYLSGKPVTLTTTATFPEKEGGSLAVRDLFARQHLTFLEDTLRLRSGLDDAAFFATLDRGGYSTKDEVVREIIDVSIDTGVQCAYTSFLVLLPEDKRRLDPRDRKALAAALDRAKESRGVKTTKAAAKPRTDGEETRAVEDPVIKDTKVDDHNESYADQSYDDSLGDPRFNSDAPFEGPGTNGTIGIGGGAGGGSAGGAWAGRRGGHRNLRAGGGGLRTETAVDLALEWLKNHQAPDGRWECDNFSAQCKLNKCDHPGEAAYTPGVSGLSLLCFLGYGDTHQSGTYKEVIKRGLKYLKSIQDSEGCFGPRTSQHFQYNHACAALAMTEAYGMTGSRLFKGSAQRGVNFVHQSQNPYLAWRYGVRDDENDTSVTGWMTMVLKSAKMAEFEVDGGAQKGAIAWIDQATDPKTGRIGYQRRGGGPARTAEMEHKFPPHRSESLTAVGSLTRIFAGQNPHTNKHLGMAADLLAQKPPVWDVEGGRIDMYYWYYGTLTMFQVGGHHWKTWNQAMKPAIVESQHVAVGRDERGSWDAVGPWAPEGGRVYSTAMLCLCLEVYYRYPRVFGGK